MCERKQYLQKRNVGMHKGEVTVHVFKLASLLCVLCLRASLLGCSCVFVCACYKAALTFPNPPRVDTVALAFSAVEPSNATGDGLC